MSIFQRFGTQAVNAVATGMTVQSVQKMMNEFGYIQNPSVTIELTLKNRRIGDSVFDYNDYTIGMQPGQNFSKGSYMGFEAVYVKSVMIQPFTDLIIVNQNRLLRKTIIHNGTNEPQEYNFTFIKPIAFSISCVNAIADGIFEVRNGSVLLDSRLWTGVFVGFFALLFVILLINSLRTSTSNTVVLDTSNKEQYMKPPPHEARIDDISDFSIMRRKLSGKFV